MARPESFFHSPILQNEYLSEPYFDPQEVKEAILWTPADLSNFRKFPGFLPDHSSLNFYYSECTYNHELNRKIDDFMGVVEHCGNYSSVERDMIGRAVIMATVCHQFNHDIEARHRRERFPTESQQIYPKPPVHQRPDGHEKPYIFHPLEIARRLVIDGFDWITVAASLLHDVPEDVDLGEGKKSKEDWFKIIRDEFNYAGRMNGLKAGINKDWEAGDLLVELIDGVTERKFSAEDFTETGEFDRIQKTALYKIFISYLERGGMVNPKREARHIYFEDKITVANVSYNLENIFDKALESPDHWRIFILKIADIWHNYQTIEAVKPEKILRGKIAASLAEWMGWYGMRSDIVELMGRETDTVSPYSPDLGVKISSVYFAEQMEKEKEMLTEDARIILNRLSKKKGRELLSDDIDVSFAGWPATSGDDFNKLYKGDFNWFPPNETDPSSLPRPEVILTADFGKLESHLSEDDRFKTKQGALGSIRIPRGITSSRVSIGRHFTDKSRIVTLLGRKRYDYSVKIGTNRAFAMRLEDNTKPYIVDLFKAGMNVTVDMIPEAAMFSNILKKTDDDLWYYHLPRLISFFYDMNTPFSHGDSTKRVFLLLLKNNFFFVPSSTEIGTFAQKFGWDLPEEIGVINLLDGKVDAQPADTNISFYRMGSSDSITFRLIVVKDEDSST